MNLKTKHFIMRMKFIQISIFVLIFSLLSFSCLDQNEDVPANQKNSIQLTDNEREQTALEHYLLEEEENSERLKKLLEQGEDPNLIFFYNRGNTGDETTALMAAIIQNRYKDCDVLLEKGADIDQKAGILQETAIGLVTSIGTLEQMNYLLDKGANPNITISDDGKTEASNGATPLIEAVIQDNFEKSQLLLEFGASPNASISDNGKVYKNEGSSVLMIACVNNNYEIAKMLLEAGADVNKPRSDNGKTIESDGSSPLSSAVLNGNLNLVNLLLAHGADPNSARSANAANDLNDGTTVLMEAVANNQLEIVKALVEAGADVNIPRSGNENISSHDGGFPLALAVQIKNIEIINYLLSEGALINQKREDSSEITSLMTAVYLGDLGIVKTLIKAGAEINLSSNKVGTALNIALDYGHDDIAEYLKNNGAVRVESYAEKNS